MVIGNTEYFGNTLNTMHTHIYKYTVISISPLYQADYCRATEKESGLILPPTHTQQKSDSTIF